MTNHIHVIAVPQRADSLANAFRHAHSIYALRFNRKYRFSGHLWQDRFYSCALDERHMWATIRYVELNPVRAGLTSKASDYPWSSPLSHCSRKEDPLLDSHWSPIATVPDWASWLALGEEDIKTEERIRSRTLSGTPCGDDVFVSRLELDLGRILHLQRSGPGPGKKRQLPHELLRPRTSLHAERDAGHKRRPGKDSLGIDSAI